MSGSSSTIRTRSMPDILTSNHEYDHLRNIGRVVADELQMLRNEDQLQRARNVSGVFDHIGQQLSKNLFVQVIDVVVFLDDFLGKVRVRIHERVQTALENALRGLTHD